MEIRALIRKRTEQSAVSYNYTPCIAYQTSKNNSQPENIRDHIDGWLKEHFHGLVDLDAYSFVMIS